MRPMAATKRPSRPLRGVVSDEFATGNRLVLLTAPMILNLFPAGAKPASTGEVILWGYLDDPMSLWRRGRGTQAMVATLKRPPPEAASPRIVEKVHGFRKISASSREVSGGGPNPPSRRYRCRGSASAGPDRRADPDDPPSHRHPQALQSH